MTSKGLVLVTGASGFIAGHCIRELLEQGYRVRGSVQSLDNKNKYQHLLDLEGGKYKDQLEFVALNLLVADGWNDAAKGCDFVMHVASPIPPKDFKHEKMILEPAINGNVFALQACLENKIRRIVITSSIVSCVPDDPKKLDFTEEDFTDPNKVSFYRKSKILAEKEAWKIYEANKDKIEMVVINPGVVFGANLSKQFFYSSTYIKATMNYEYPSLPRVKEGFVDVKDVAIAHVKALEVPEANGHRFIISEGSYYLRYLSEVLTKEYKPKGYKILSGEMSYIIFFFACFTSTYMKGIKSLWKKDIVYNSEKSKRILGMQYRPIEPSIIETAEWLMDNGFVKRK